MTKDLDDFLGYLVTLISCAGEHGCSVDELVGAIRDSLSPPCSPQDATHSQPNKAASIIWSWLVDRSDIAVGRERQYNHLSLTELLALPHGRCGAHGPSTGKGGEGETLHETREHVAKDASFDDHDAIRVYSSEATMWEVVTGHAVDFKRIPRSEWLLLVGIANSQSHGILQGDLGRLVDQDKRSVPKRTDSLAKKGYICKRTTLVRGTKTSKMWLRAFAPPLPKEYDAVEIPEPDLNLPLHLLAENLDPVPWRVRWTGQDIDYTALATTILAVVKEWEVMRVRDLKAKLGVLGMRWQMKTVAKTCRYLNSRGVIQFVAAKLDNRVFKDCVKFRREMNAQDWKVYLSTGRRAGKPSRSIDQVTGDGLDEGDQYNMERADYTRLSLCPPWTLDKPLPHTIARLVQSVGRNGLSNPDIYALTLGATFNRFISSLTGSLSTSRLQPPYLQHLQMRSEHVRVGKIASYLFFLPPTPIQAVDASRNSVVASVEVPGEPALACGFYGSLSTASLPNRTTSNLTDICVRGPRRKRKERSLRRQARSKPELQLLNGRCSSGFVERVVETPDLHLLAETPETQLEPNLLDTSRLQSNAMLDPAIEDRGKVQVPSQDSNQSQIKCLYWTPPQAKVAA
ncbi:hypothetical protein XA68_14130 [Ophiocordyceps unilateralis]|uniref:B-block binding subunit of TFIIIC domain-containing protein n=1 Tax=Ophiocordyceps unilateralis TaxID=268505 RepID=A0A2A9PBC7_OPHUN|nr:hypothetical protein XA68_14130 [Ophiocordyceps unilateralis]